MSKQDLSPGVGQAIRGAMQRLGLEQSGDTSKDTLIVDVRRVAAKAQQIGEAASHPARRKAEGPRFDLAFTEQDYSTYGLRPS